LSGASVLCTGNQRVAFYLILFWRDGIASVAGSVLPTSSPAEPFQGHAANLLLKLRGLMVHREGFEPPRPTWGDRVTAGPFLPGSRTCANLRGLRWESSDVPTLSVLQLQTWPYALRLPNVLSVQTLCCLGGVPSIRCQSGISMGDGLLRQHCVSTTEAQTLCSA
jgi:hypothetical protein